MLQVLNNSIVHDGYGCICIVAFHRHRAIDVATLSRRFDAIQLFCIVFNWMSVSFILGEANFSLE